MVDPENIYALRIETEPGYSDGSGERKGYGLFSFFVRDMDGLPTWRFERRMGCDFTNPFGIGQIIARKKNWKNISTRLPQYIPNIFVEGNSITVFYDLNKGEIEAITHCFVTERVRIKPSSE